MFREACYKSARTSFIGERSVAGADVQPVKLRTVLLGCQVFEKKKKDIRILKLTMECRPTERILDLSNILVKDYRIPKTCHSYSFEFGKMQC